MLVLVRSISNCVLLRDEFEPVIESGALLSLIHAEVRVKFCLRDFLRGIVFDLSGVIFQHFCEEFVVLLVIKADCILVHPEKLLHL